MLNTFGAGISQSIKWLTTDWTTEGIRGYIPDRGKRFISSSELPDRLRDPLSLQWLPVSDFKGVKRPWNEADHSYLVPGTNGAKPPSPIWLRGVQGTSLLDFASSEAVKYQRNSWHWFTSFILLNSAASGPTDLPHYGLSHSSLTDCNYRQLSLSKQ
jgi:hypothetical protein